MTLKNRRINLRIAADIYAELDKKRAAEQTSFQDVGARLFARWARQEDRKQSRLETMTEEESEKVEALLKFLRTNRSNGLLVVLDTILFPNPAGKRKKESSG